MLPQIILSLTVNCLKCRKYRNNTACNNCMHSVYKRTKWIENNALALKIVILFLKLLRRTLHQHHVQERITDFTFLSLIKLSLSLVFHDRTLGFTLIVKLLPNLKPTTDWLDFISRKKNSCTKKQRALTL